MKTIINVGMTGTGKTTRVFNILDKLDKKQKFIYDINREYEKYNSIKELPSLPDFENLITKVRNSVVVVEEATIFFPNRGYSNKMVDALVRKRHTNNFFILNFHSINDIPIYISKLSDYILLSKTFDTENVVLKKFNRQVVVNAFSEVKNHPSRYFHKEVKLI